jgi:hypothetical protein
MDGSYQIGSNITHPLNQNFAAFQGIIPQGNTGTGFHPHVHPKGCHRGGVPAATHAFGQSTHMFGFGGDPFHIGFGGTDIFGGDVLARKRIYKTTVGLEQSLGFVLTGIPKDDGFSATQIQPSDRCLVGHPLG